MDANGQLRLGDEQYEKLLKVARDTNRALRRERYVTDDGKFVIFDRTANYTFIDINGIASTLNKARPLSVRLPISIGKRADVLKAVRRLGRLPATSITLNWIHKEVVKVLVAAVLLVCFLPTRLFAAPLPPSQDYEASRRILAVTIVAEADGSVQDWKAMSWVLAKRWGIRHKTRPEESFAAFVKKFASVWKVDTSRAKILRQLVWGKSALPKRRRRVWADAQDFVLRWQAGRVPDPCPTALNWGGTMDVPVGQWEPVNCGRTRNIFYALR